MLPCRGGALTASHHSSCHPPASAAIASSVDCSPPHALPLHSIPGVDSLSLSLSLSLGMACRACPHRCRCCVVTECACMVCAGSAVASSAKAARRGLHTSPVPMLQSHVSRYGCTLLCVRVYKGDRACVDCLHEKLSARQRPVARANALGNRRACVAFVGPPSAHASARSRLPACRCLSCQVSPAVSFRRSRDRTR
jgi:hypothetical protein